MTLDNQGIPIVFGGGADVLWTPTDTSAKDVPALLDLLAKHNIKYIDSAISYGESETQLGTYKAVERGFIVDTKFPGGLRPGSLKKDSVIELGRASLKKLNTKKIRIFYIHAPDANIPFAETLAGINTLYQEGVFEQFGLSNFRPDQVQEVYDLAKQNGYVLPTVFQGSYNAFGRHYEKEGNLLPLLRKLKISFYAYSPAAGGFLSKTPDKLFESGGRFDKNSGSILAGYYNSLYSDKPSMMKGYEQWIALAQEANIKPVAMALRWVRYNSALKPEFGDALIVGGRTMTQIDEALTEVENGPLPDDIVTKIDAIWNVVKDEAIADKYHDHTFKK